MKKNQLHLITYLIFFSVKCYGSTLFNPLPPHGAISGYIYGKSTQLPIASAQVTLFELDSNMNTTTNSNGFFTIKNLTVGRKNISVKLLGYRSKMIEGILVNSGKETFIEIFLDDSVNVLEEVVIKSENDNREPINSSILAGGKKFSVEETQKYPVAVNDPSRMITSFPGVISVDDGGNGVSIRGNSPNGLLWRLEGIEIPNPNHFANIASSGGGISVLSAQLLSNSDFLNAAFPSEYGNALSGVFDMRLRQGNNQKREYTIQAGLIGIDLSTEGPFKKGKDATFLVNYRYSTLGLMSKLGVDITNGLSRFQDLSFNIYFPTKYFGTFSIFGIGGISSQINDSKLIDFLGSNKLIKLKSTSLSNMGVIGFKHNYVINSKASVKTLLSSSGNYIQNKGERADSTLPFYIFEDRRYSQFSFSLYSSLYYQINNKINLKFGLVGTLPIYDLREGSLDSLGQLRYSINSKGIANVNRSFVQVLARVSKKTTLNIGLHYVYFSLGKSSSLEPRISVKQIISDRYTLSLAYGLHSQIHSLGTYFINSFQNDSGAISNIKLGFAKSNHFLFSQNFLLNKYNQIKLDFYFQYLFNIPISPDTANKSSILNVSDGYLNEKLVSKGLGKNYGSELSFEHSFHKNWYCILSASLFDSKYLASDGIWRNTLYNSKYGYSATAGYESVLSKSSNPIIFGLNLKALYFGGFRTTPIDLNQSIIEGREINLVNKTNEEKLPDYKRIDLRVSFRKNFKKSTQMFSIDIQNLLNKENISRRFYDPLNKRIGQSTQNGLIPVLSYRLEF